MEWIVYYDLSPWGEKRADLRSGIIASTVYNTARGRNSQAMKAADFMPDFGDEEPQTIEEMQEQLLAGAKLKNG